MFREGGEGKGVSRYKKISPNINLDVPKSRWEKNAGLIKLRQFSHRPRVIVIH